MLKQILKKTSLVFKDKLSPIINDGLRNHVFHVLQQSQHFSTRQGNEAVARKFEGPWGADLVASGIGANAINANDAVDVVSQPTRHEAELVAGNWAENPLDILKRSWRERAQLA